MNTDMCVPAEFDVPVKCRLSLSLYVLSNLLDCDIFMGYFGIYRKKIIYCQFVSVALALASYECEPPDSSYEKHHYKQLK